MLPGVVSSSPFCRRNAVGAQDVRLCRCCTLPRARFPVENIFSIFEGGSAFLPSGLGPYPVGQVQYDRGAGHFSIQFPVHARMDALVIMQIVSVLNLGAALVG